MTFSRNIQVLFLISALSVAVASGGCSSSADSSEGSNGPSAGGGADAAASSSGSSGSSGGFDGEDASSSWDGGTGGGCQPADVSSYKPAWRKAGKFYQGVCTSTEIDKFRSACLGKDTSGCAKSVSADCAKCIATDEAADTYGALIVHTGWVELNIPGCVANAMGDPSGVRCGGAMQAAAMCELAACSANCPVTNDATLTSLGVCRQAADQGQCKPLVDDAQCASGLAEAGPSVAACVSAKSFNDAYTTIAGMFCLTNPTPPPPQDAGGGG